MRINLETMSEQELVDLNDRIARASSSFTTVTPEMLKFE